MQSRIEVTGIDAAELRIMVKDAVIAALQQTGVVAARDWITKSEYAAMLGVTSKTLSNTPWRLPEIRRPGSRACIARADAIAYLAMDEHEMRRRYRNRFAGQGLKVAK